MKIDSVLLRKIIEGALLAADEPLSLKKIASLFEIPEGSELELTAEPEEQPGQEEILAALEDIQADCKGRGYELKEVGSGWRFQVIQETARWINRLWEEKPQKYSRALLETLVLIAYRQPITRGDIESIRGVAVSSNIIKTLVEREWVKVVGHRDVPGRPALYATTRPFLDYFNLKSLDELPSLSEIKDFEKFDSQFDFQHNGDPSKTASESETAAANTDELRADTEELSGEADAEIELTGSDSEAAAVQELSTEAELSDADFESEAADTELPPADAGPEPEQASASETSTDEDGGREIETDDSARDEAEAEPNIETETGEQANR